MSSATSPPAKAPKTMSSKLLTMKFMQRAATSSPISSPASPQPSPKRQKIGNSSPGALDVESLAGKGAVQAALAAEEAKRQVALERQAEDAGDARWTLSFKEDDTRSNAQNRATLRVVQTGFATIDDGQAREVAVTYNDEKISDRSFIIGRRSFGKFNRIVEKLQDPKTEDWTDSDSAEDEDEKSEDNSDNGDDNDPNSANTLVKAARQEAANKLKAEHKVKRRAEKAESIRLAEKRKKKDINLNRLTSISGGSSATNQACHRCGKVGHLQADCPKRARDHTGGEKDRPRMPKISR